MEDFEKTRSLVRDFNSFCDIVSKLRHNDIFKLSDSQIEALTDDMKKYCDNTYCRGEELANEAKDICPDVMDLKKYVSIWESQLNEINTAWMEDEETFNDGFWKARIGEYHTCQMFGLLYQMRGNYIDVKDSVWNLKNSYSLNECEEPVFTFVEEKKKMIQAASKSRNKVTKTDKDIFSRLINTQFDKTTVLKWLHQNIDGQRPKDIGLVIAYAVGESLLRREPKENEFRSEFNVKCNWTGIWKYFHKYDEPEDKEKEEHDQSINESIPETLKFPFET